MHKRGFASRPIPESGKPPVKDNRLKNKNINLKNKKATAPKSKASVGSSDKEKTISGEVQEEAEQVSSAKRKETENSSNPSIPSLELKLNHLDTASQNLIPPEDGTSKEFIQILEGPLARTYCDIEQAKTSSIQQIPEKSDNIDNEAKESTKALELPKPAPIFRYVLEPAKPKGLDVQIGPLSQKGNQGNNEIDMFYVSKANPFLPKSYLPIPREPKPLITERFSVLNWSEDSKVNRSFLPPKRALSPINVQNTADSTKGNRIGLPLLKTQKAVLLRKNLAGNGRQKKIDGVRLNKSRAEENSEGGAVRSQPLSKIQSEIEMKEEGANRGSIRSILGQVVNSELSSTGCNINMKGIAKEGNQIGSYNDENFKEGIEYIVSMYKAGADKALDRLLKVPEQLPGCSKGMTYFRKTPDVQQKMKQSSHNETFGDYQSGKDLKIKNKEPSVRISHKPQNKNDTSFRVRRIKGILDEKKSFCN